MSENLSENVDRAEADDQADPQARTSRRRFFGVATAIPAALGAAAILPAAAAAQQSKGASTWDRVMDTKTLRVGAIVGEEPNFHKDPQSGEWAGFNIDMGRDIAKILGAKLDIIETTWGGSVLDLQTNKVDIAFSLQATPKRAMVIEFTDPIYEISMIIVPRKGFTAKTWEDLNQPSVRLSVDSGSVHEAIARRYAPKAEISSFKTRDEAMLSTVTGRTDANVATTLLGILAMKKNPQMGQMITPTPVLTLGSYFGVRQGDYRWANFLSAWGTYNRSVGQVREWILNNLKYSGLEQEDIPPGVQF